MSEEDAVHPIEVVDPCSHEKISVKLLYEVRQPSLKGYDLFVIVHSSGTVSTVRVFSQKDKGLKLLKEIGPSCSEMRQPRIFYVIPDGSAQPVQLVHISEVSNGSGAITSEYVFEVVFDGHLNLRDVSLLSAVQAYQSSLREGERIRQDAHITFTSEGLFCVFYIWNGEDPNCCPSGGKVFGTYKIVQDKGKEGRLSIVPDTFERYPILPGEY